MHKNVPENGCNSVIWVHKNSSVKVLSELSYVSELYLKLEDVTRRFLQPCIMDVKIGRRSYDPFASKEKREEQISKYPLMEEIGFLLLGMRVRQHVCDLSTFLILIMQGLLFFCCFISVSSSWYLIFLLQTVRLHKHNIKLRITRVRALKVWCQCCTTEIPVCCLVRLDQYSELIRTLG